jgi:hypothetical protein
VAPAAVADIRFLNDTLLLVLIAVPDDRPGALARPRFTNRPDGPCTTTAASIQTVEGDADWDTRLDVVDVLTHKIIGTFVLDPRYRQFVGNSLLRVCEGGTLGFERLLVPLIVSIDSLHSRSQS